MTGGTSRTSSSLPTGDLEQPLLGRVERQRAEIEAPLLDFDGNLPRGHAADVGGDVGVALAEPRDERQQRVDGGLVGADEHAAAAQIAQLAHRRLGLLRQAHEPLAVVLQHLARLRSACRVFDERSNSCSPRSASSRRTAWLTAGWVRCTLAAAREKLRSWATARKIVRAASPWSDINQSYSLVMIITLTSSPADRLQQNA